MSKSLGSMIGCGVAVVALAASLLALYHVRIARDGLAREERKITREMAEVQASLAVLDVEWAYLTRPERLRALAEKHLALAVPGTTQVTQLASVPMRGPATVQVAASGSAAPTQRADFNPYLTSFAMTAATYRPASR